MMARLRRIFERLRKSSPTIIKKIETRKTADGVFTSYDYEKPSGRVVMFLIKEDKDGWILHHSFVPKKLQGRGITTEFAINMNFESMRKTGNPLESSDHLLADGIAFWESLVKKNMAVKTDNGYKFAS